MNRDIRWIQRFAHFEKAYRKLSEVVEMRDMSELEEEGFVQRFEFTLELAWKTLRDFLTEEGFSMGSPKETVRQAYESGYLSDAQVWIDMIDLRNIFSHDYDGKLFSEKEYFLREDAFHAIEKLYIFLTSRK